MEWKRIVFILMVVCFSRNAIYAGSFHQDVAWPLCGRIAENPPAGWKAVEDGCPSSRWGSFEHTDLPLAATFGPRPLASENDRYDFHRGIDIATDVGTPVFAIADGIVKVAGDHPSYSDPLVQLRHYRPGYSSCRNVGCYHTNYMHLQSVAVKVDDVVKKGDLIGYTGKSASGFAHLHFEIRNAPPFDPYSRWQRDAIHPLEVLPYRSSAQVTITFVNVDTDKPDKPIVRVRAETTRADVKRLELSLYDRDRNLIQQPGNKPNVHGYNVYPAWFDMNVWNFQYTHKNSKKFPWQSFSLAGDNECPFHTAHGSRYKAHVHLDAPDPTDFRVGRFNGVAIRTRSYKDGTYFLDLTFESLQGPAYCIAAKVGLATGGESTAQWGNCEGIVDVRAPAQR